MEKIKILIIDDEESITKALELKLEKEGFETKIASNGEEGLIYLQNEKYDLILLDLVMPKVDGFETLNKINEKNIKTPVIIISNLSQYSDIKKIFELGAKDFLVKSDTPLSYVVKKVKEIAVNKKT